MKKTMLGVLGVISVLVALGGITSVARADDSAPNTLYWMKDDTKVTCVSFDLSEVPNNYFLVFDYDVETGISRGKPWTVVAEGKCYQVLDETAKLYAVEAQSGDELEQFSNYNAYAPSQSVRDTFCSPVRSDERIDFNGTAPCYSEMKIQEVVLPFTEQLGVTFVDSLFKTHIYINELFPTKYTFGAGVTQFVASFGTLQQKLSEDYIFIEAKGLHESLALELSNALHKCDMRVRTEYKSLPTYTEWRGSNPDVPNAGIAINSNIVVWRLSDNADYTIGRDFRTLDSETLVDKMGCSETYHAFLRAHQSDFSRLDELGSELRSKYFDEGKLIDYFVAPRVVPDSTLHDTTVIQPAEASYTESMPHITLEEVYAQAQATAKPVEYRTELDEPTPAQKQKYITGSTNTALQIYILLPLFALLGFGLLFWTRNRR